MWEVDRMRGPYPEARKILRARRDAVRALEATSAANDLPTEQVWLRKKKHLPMQGAQKFANRGEYHHPVEG